MTSPGGQAPAGQAAADDLEAAAPAPNGRADGVVQPTAAGQLTANGVSHEAAGASAYDPGPVWARYLPPAVALALGLWRVTVPSFWRDEAATISAVRRPLHDLIAMLGNVDAVHSAYYLVMWVLVHLFGTGELVLRLPSVLAAAAAAAGVAALGRRLVSAWSGLAAGLILAVLPTVSRFGQEARPYAAVIALATLASYLLVRVFGARAPARGWWLVGYGASLAALGIANIFGLLLIGAHAVTVALYYRRDAGERAARRLAVGWLAAALAGVAGASPLLVLGWRQKDQIAWLAVNKSNSGLGTVLLLPGSILVTAPLILAIGIALVVAAESSPQRRKANWPRLVPELCLPWLVLPPLALFVTSALHPSSPVYTPRYFVMCVPALVLLASSAVVTLGRVGGPVALAVIAVAGIPAQFNTRLPYGHYDDIRYLDQVVAAQARPGDVVLYPNPNADSFGAAYPRGLSTLPDIGIKRAAIPSGSLAGTPASFAQIRSRLAAASRVWVVQINGCTIAPQVDDLKGLPLGGGQPVLADLPLHVVAVWHEPHSGDWLVLYAHGPGTQVFVCPPH
jgi:mannosyltransferase